MANKLRYQIEEVYDKNDNKKVLDPAIKLQQYFVHFAIQGKSARLVSENGKTLKTTEVEEIFIWENGIKLTTENTIYYLKPYMVGENDEFSERLF